MKKQQGTTDIFELNMRQDKEKYANGKQNKKRRPIKAAIGP